MNAEQPQCLFGRFPEKIPLFERAQPLVHRREILGNAVVWPGSGLIRKADEKLEFEPIWIKEHLVQCGDYASKWSYFPVTHKGLYFNLSLFWWQNYYHWFADVLTRLQGLLPLSDLELKIILPSGMAAWQRRSLELIGVPENQCIFYSGKRPWRLEKLLYHSPVIMTGNQTVESLLWLRNRLLSSSRVLLPSTGWRKIYLSRKGERSRHILNEEEYLPLLRENGFEVINCAQLALEEQIRIFSEAQCVVAPHGAALTNILYAPPEAKIFEIFEPESIRQCYWSMSVTLGHDYHFGVGTSVVNPSGEANLSVRGDELLSALKTSGFLS